MPSRPGGADPWWAVAVATAIAFVIGYAVIAWLLRYLAHHGVGLFVAYRLVLGALVLALALAAAGVTAWTRVARGKFGRRRALKTA